MSLLDHGASDTASPPVEHAAALISSSFLVFQGQLVSSKIRVRFCHSPYTTKTLVICSSSVTRSNQIFSYKILLILD